MAKSVETLEVIAWPDLGCEAVRRLTVRDMPLTVILDATAAICTSPARRRIWKAKTNGVLSPLHKTKPAWNWQTRCFVQKKVGLFLQTSCELLASTAKV